MRGENLLFPAAPSRKGEVPGVRHAELNRWAGFHFQVAASVSEWRLHRFLASGSNPVLSLKP
jgi:hypothetical protein